MTLYHGVVSTILSLSKCSTLSLLSYSTLLNAYRTFDSSNSALLLLSVDSDNAPKAFPPDGLEPYGYFSLFGPLLPMVC